MRRRGWLVVPVVLGLTLASLALSPRRAAAQEAAPLRMEDAVQLALANNERAKKAPLRVEQAAGQLERARDAFFPTLSAGAL
ncbi:MAG: TolC family protein [Myxococcales bacterium]|nr:TolC family protein [Myxococcales bacterium]